MSQHMDLIELEQGKLYVHNADVCAGEICVIHNQTDHHMVTWPMVWRFNPDIGDYRGIMERRCPHGTGHPDPDDLKIRTGVDSGIHACDGCCSVKS